MSRNWRLSGAVGLLSQLIVLVLVVAASGAAAGRQAPRPNIVVVMTDDQTLESMRVMSNVRRLIAARGATLANSFVNLSLCCPSRATFLTGQYAHNHGVLGNEPPAGGYQKLDHTRTLPVWLQRAGYATIHIGKYLNGYGSQGVRMIPPGWTEWYGSPDPLNGYNYFDFSLNENGTIVHYGADPASYKTDVETRRAVGVIERRAASPQPFFIWVAYLASHDGGPGTKRVLPSPLPAPRHLGRFANEPLPMPPSFNEQDVSDKPLFMQRPLLTAQQIDIIRKQYRLRLESLQSVDEGVARIVEALDKSGELDNTLFVYTSDNGYFQGEHRVPEGKVFLYEPSIRVPLLVRGPGVPAGLVLQELVANIDLAPTILDVAGAEPDRVLDGRSLVPLFRNPSVRWGRYLLLEGTGIGPGGSSPAFVAIRTPRFVYAERFTGERELYDLARDPDELESRHDDRAYAGIRSELAQRLAGLRRCAGADCRTGPAVVLTARAEHPCRRRIVTLRITGADASHVSRVQFLLAGRRLGTDVRPPFALRTRAARGTARALIGLFDGQLVSRERRIACR